MEYAAHLDAGDLDALRNRTRLTAVSVANGATVENVLGEMLLCLDWSSARLISANTPVTPLNGVAVLTDGSRELAISMGFAERDLDHVSGNTWYAVLDMPPC